MGQPHKVRFEITTGNADDIQAALPDAVINGKQGHIVVEDAGEVVGTLLRLGARIVTIHCPPGKQIQ